MTLSDDNIKVLKIILEEKCSDTTPVSRSEIFAIFENRARTGLEEYRFKKILSDLIRQEKICGYEIKVGRNGGISKTESIEQLTVTCSYGRYVGNMPASQLAKLILPLKKVIK